MTTEEFKSEAKTIRPQLIGLAQRYLGDIDDAEDVVQDALLRLWQMHEQLHSPLERMAKVVTRNLAIDYLRRRKHSESLELVGEEEHQEDSRMERILGIIATLPPMQQTILRLRHMEDMEMADIAELIGSNEVAVRKSLSRARKLVLEKYLSIKNDE
jgi:RNA polymerase sigma-70 factor (ECF subfamily)